MFAEDGWVANSTELEQLPRLDCAGGENDLAVGIRSDKSTLSILDQDLDSRRSHNTAQSRIKLDFLKGSLFDEVQVWPICYVICEVGRCRVLPYRTILTLSVQRAETGD